MNRVIKFDAWSSTQNKMFCCEEMTKDQLALLPDGYFANIHSVDTRLSKIYTHEEMLPLQYTGFTDIKGKEIVEGHILHLEFEGLKMNGVVMIDEKMEWIFYKDEGNYLGVHHNIDRVEVIGNIYENPELLTPQPKTIL